MLKAVEEARPAALEHLPRGLLGYLIGRLDRLE
jgi:hypothetical protein